MHSRLHVVAIAACAATLSAFAASAAEDNPAAKLGRNTPADQQGRQVFMQARCFACHGEYGNGGVGPRFRQDRFLGIADYVIGQILIGRGVMPSFAEALDDKQIAAVASYVRNSWGNQFGPVKPEQVAQVRNEVKLHPPQGRPHQPPYEKQESEPMPPNSPLPPGQAQPPGDNK